MPDRVAKSQRLAEAVGRQMYERDRMSKSLGIRLEEIRPGYARMTMHISPDMVNAHGALHGGMSYTLADTAFAYACNSHNHIAVAAGCNIVYPAAGAVGDVLTAEAVERHIAGRNGVYDVTVTNQRGEVLALFRGSSRRLQGTIVAAEEKTLERQEEL